MTMISSPTLTAVMKPLLLSRRLTAVSTTRRIQRRQLSALQVTTCLQHYPLPAASSLSSHLPPTHTASSTRPFSSNNYLKLPDQDMELKLAKMNTEINELYKRGDFPKALKMSIDYLKHSQAHFGTDHPATASALNNVGLMHKLLGNYIEARQHYVAASRTYAKILGRDHASYAMTLHNLGNLNKTQVHMDSELRATDRLSLVEQALEYLEEALFIRIQELGEEHPLTIATKSSIGSTLAAQVLHEYKMVQDGKDGNRYVSLNSQEITTQQWQAAEEHLREALQLAMDNPRGKSIGGVKKKGKQKKGKQNKKQPSKKQQSDNPLQTLSAALAAQNLAVVLKSRAMTVEDNTVKKELLEEAKTLYQHVLDVRLQLLPSKDHPDVYATKYSLAELLEVMGDEETANVLRQEILDTYQPSEEEIEEKPKTVVIEKTKANAKEE